MVMIAFVGVATFDKPGKGATSIFQAVIFSKSEAPVEEPHTGSFLCFIRFLRSCGAPGSQTLVGAYRIPGTQVSLPIVVRFIEEPIYVRLSGAEGGKPIATLASRRGVFGLIQPPADI
jgi:hypothetical protein